MKHASLLLAVLFSALLCSCGPDEPVNPSYSGLNIEKGVFVLNEGTYLYANSSLTYYDPEADTVANNLFYRVNGAPIGDVGQSLCLMDGQLYIVVNNSNYIYKVDARTLACDTTQRYKLDGFYSPRYMIPLSPDKVYVSDLSGKDLWIGNPQQMTITGTIAIGKPTETMVLVGKEVYVANWSNYYDTEVMNNTVMVVDAVNDMKVCEITVGKEPNGMVVDSQGQVWVLCEGAYWDVDMEYPTLWRIDPQSKKAFCERVFSTTAMGLAIDPQGEHLYCIEDGDVCRMAVNAPATTDAFRIPAEGRTFYKITVNPNNGELYVTDAKNYAVSGTVYRYTSDGLLLSSFNAGICPSYILFKN